MMQLISDAYRALYLPPPAREDLHRLADCTVRDAEAAQFYRAVIDLKESMRRN
jgi:hypothetical protein